MGRSWHDRRPMSADGVRSQPRVSRSGLASTSAATSRSGAATRSSSRASSARRPTSSPRTTCGPARASFLDAVAARHDDFDVLFASKAFPCTAVYRVLAEEGLACDVASGGELFLALRGGFDPARIYLHGNAKSERELHEALDAGVGHIVLDSLARARPPRADRRRARRAPGGADPDHAGRRGRHAPRDLDRSGRLEVRVRRRPGARGDRAAGGGAASGARRPALPHRLPALRARAVPRRGPDDRDARRLSRSTTSAAASGWPTRPTSSLRRSTTTSTRS